MLITSALMSFSQSAQLVLSADSLCAGDTLYAFTTAPQLSLSGGTGTNNQNGMMFDLVSLQGCLINDFAINNLSGPISIEVYSKAGSHVGYESIPAAWTLVGTASNVQSGSNIELGLSLGIAMSTGQIRAFYITTTNPSFNLAYGNAVAVGNLISSNPYLQLKTGVGKSYPFGTTFASRDFIGRIIHSPEVVSVVWNTGDTISSLVMTPVQSLVLSATLTLAGNTIHNTGRKAVMVSDLHATATADPYLISPGGSSTLTGLVTLKRGIATTMAGGNNHNGAMFDVVTSSPLKIEGFTIHHTGAAGTVEVLYKSGTHEGFEANAAAWTSIGIYSQLAGGAGDYLSLATPINVASGQTIAFYITSTTNHNLTYSNGTMVGLTAASAPGIAIKEGKGVEYPFGNTYDSRILNTIIHYEVANPSGSLYQWSSGGSGGSVLVSPGVTTTYTLQVTNSGCQKSDTVTVVVSGIGVEEHENAGFLVYPNPATDMLTVEALPGLGSAVSTMYDLNGRRILQSLQGEDTNSITIPVSHLPAGTYVLKIKQGQHEKTAKVHILR